MENSKKASFQASIPSELSAQLNELRTKLGMTNSELLQYLVSFNEKPYRSELSHKQVVEKEIQELLKGDKKITTYLIRKGRGKSAVGAKTAMECMELYKTEIDQHNAKFSE